MYGESWKLMLGFAVRVFPMGRTIATQRRPGGEYLHRLGCALLFYTLYTTWRALREQLGRYAACAGVWTAQR